jgi:hypothetical protein
MFRSLAGIGLARRGPRGAIILVAAFFVVFLLPASASAFTLTFGFTGAAQTFTVPAGVTQVSVDAFGAQGGQAQDGPAGGLGGRAIATIAVTPGEVLQINVGGQPAAGNPAPGGFNGGGASGTASGAATLNSGGGGGGASDVRRGGTGLADRVVVAGGGGGGGGSSCSDGGTGGTGGGTSGGNASICAALEGRGGTQSAGGANGTGGFDGSAGASGTGGSGGPGIDFGEGAHSGGGGGGGLFGGGGGNGFQVPLEAGGGGGGSGFTPNGTGMTSGVRAGNGEVSITYQPPASSTVVTCTPDALQIGQASTCAAVVTGSSPTGSVNFTAEGPGVLSAASCALSAGSCSVTYTPSGLGDATHSVTGAYQGDANNAPSSGSDDVTLSGPPISGPPITSPGPTGRRAAALKKCTKRKRPAARRKCRKRAKQLPL